jgi:HK97 family phage portal protein
MDLDQKRHYRDWLSAFRRPNSQKAAGDSSGVTWVGDPDTRRIIHLDLGGAHPDADNLTRSIALATSAYCYTAVSYRWRTVSEPPIGVMRETEEGLEPVARHPLEFLLTDPSPDYDMGELQAITEAYRLITGAALWVKMRAGENGTGAVTRLVPYSGDQFQTESFEGRIYGRFRVDTDMGQKIYLPEDVVHFREINPGSWRTNLSATDVALTQLNIGHHIARTIKNFMLRAMFPGGVISPDADWNPDEDEFQAYVNRINAWHAGPGNAGEPLVLLGGTTFSQTSLSLKDLLPDELLDRIEATVASCYGIPPVVLGWLVGLRNSPWSQMSEARRMTYEDTIEPRWRDIEKRMTRQMLTPAERAADMDILFDTSDVRALQNDDAQRATTASTMRREWTLNERREYTGQEPLEDERGEEIEGIASGDGLGDGDGGGIVDDDEEDDEDEEMAGPGPDLLKYLNNPKGLHWLLFDANCKAAESSWEREIYKALQLQLTAILKLADEYLEEEKQTDPNSAATFAGKVDQLLDDTLPEFLALVFPLVFSTAKTGVKQVAAKLGLSFDILQEGLLGYAEREAAFLASKMTETTGRAVASAVQKGLEQGETVGALTKRLEGLPAFDRARAKLTARTETTRAWNGAQRETLSGYQAESGRQVYKTWVNAGDDRVRDAHLNEPTGVGEERVPIDSEFSNSLQGPSEPNCRCTLIYDIEG